MPNDPSLEQRPTIDYPRQAAEPGTLDETGAYDAAPITASSATPAPPGDWPTIAGYELTAEIARGGMGRVFAGRELALDREIAVKTLLPGADAERFVTESKITARLPHPGIPPVHALGTLADGSRYLAMKLIRGRTLADLLKERQSPGEDLPRWVQVFEQIAQAVGFAHAQGIIHRDLKPANVMVGAFGEVQVMDWGLAKMVRGQESGVGSQESNAKPQDERSDSWGSHATQSGTILGTPGFMSPEQARGEAVDARADVFALGAILTVILTGKPPFIGKTKEELIDQAAANALTDALTRLDACGADKELIALAKLCLATAVPDRPADARLIAEQVAAYRAGVESRLRQAENERAAALVREAESRKRRRQFAISAGIITAVLVAGISGTSYGMWSASHQAYEKDQALIREGDALKKEKDRADSEAKAVVAEKLANEKEREATKKEREATKKERAATAVAVGRLAEFQKANALMESIFTDIDPRLEEKGGPLVIEQLTKRLLDTADKLDEEAISDPITVARLQSFLGTTLGNLGNPARALALHKKALATREKLLGLDNADTLLSMSNVANAYHNLGQRDVALPLYLETHKLMKDKLGPDHNFTLISANNLASGYQAAGKLDLALPLFEETFERRVAKHGREHPDTFTSMSNLAVCYRAAGKLDLALPLYKETFSLMKARLGPEHADTLNSMNNLATAYQDAGKLGLALPLYEEAFNLRKRKLGPDHPNTLGSMNNLAYAYRNAGRLDLALPLYTETLRLMKAKVGPEHPDTFVSMNNLATAYREAGKLNLAVPLFEETLKLRVAKLGPDHPDTLDSINNLAFAFQAGGNMAKALPLFEETLAKRRAMLDPDHPSTLLSIGNLATAYHANGQSAKAVPLF
jgi:eukaryotic-like serine/threonine-protein kinase